MNILIANSFHYYRGGDCTYTFNVSKLLNEIGNHKVVHFAMKYPLNLPSEYSEFFVLEIDLPRELAKNGIRTGIRVVRRVIYSNKSKEKLSKLLDKYPVDIAQIHNIHRHITPSIFHTLRKRNIPIIWRLSDYFLLCPNSTFFSKNKVCEACKGKKFYNVLLRKCRKNSYAASLVVMLEEYIHRFSGLLKLVDFFITPSQFLGNKMIEYDFPSDKIVNIPSFIETKNIIPSSKDKDYLLYSGRLSYEKGVETLIKAIALSNSVKLLIAGDGSLRQELESLANNISPKRVKFLGHLERKKLQEIICGAKFIVMPSECYENFPNSVLEAFALGKPVVGSRIGGIPELLKDGETGLLFEPGNAQDLADKIQWMLFHPKERKEMGQRARELVEKEFNPEVHYERLMKVYKMALAKHGKAFFKTKQAFIRK